MTTTAVMSYPTYLLLNVSLFLCFIRIMGMIRQVQTNNFCNNGSSGTVTMNCTHPSGVIEVLSLLYANLQNQSYTCPVSMQEANCSEIIITGNLLRKNFFFSSCSALTQCSQSIPNWTSELQTCSSYNYFMANYTCIQETEMMDQCGNETRNVTSPTHLIYFHGTQNNRVQNCTCVVQGGPHQLMAVNVKMPQTTEQSCTNVSLRMDWSKSGKKESREITNASTALTNEYLVNDSDITWIYYTRNCSTITRNVWFKLHPVGDSQPVIYCGSSVANRPLTHTTMETKQSSIMTEESTYPINVSNTTMNGTETTDYVSSPTTNSSTGLSSTQQNQTGMSASTTSSPMSSTTITKNSTSNTSTINNKQGNHSSKVAVIVGSVIGGFFVVVIAVILVIFLYRRHKSRKYTESTVPMNYSKHRVMYENSAADLPLVVRSPPSRTTGYDHIGADGTMEGMDNPGMHNNNGGNVYNHTAEGEEYDHIQIVATIHPSSETHCKPTDNTYNKLSQGHNNIGQLRDKDSLLESSTDTYNNTSATVAAAIYSEIPDKLQSGESGEGKTPISMSHKSSGLMNEEIELEENDMYENVDRSNSARSSVRGPQRTHFYHVLEKEDFSSRVPEHPAHSADNDVDHDHTASSSPHKSPGQSNDDIEFEENDLYESADQL